MVAVLNFVVVVTQPQKLLPISSKYMFFVLEPDFTLDKFVQLVLIVSEEVKCSFYACHTFFLKDMTIYFNTTFTSATVDPSDSDSVGPGGGGWLFPISTPLRLTCRAPAPAWRN